MVEVYRPGSQLPVRTAHFDHRPLPVKLDDSSVALGLPRSTILCALLSTCRKCAWGSVPRYTSPSVYLGCGLRIGRPSLWRPYPGCKLVRYDPKTAKLEDLGRMDPTEQYGRWIVGSKDGFMYMAIGTSKANIAAFNVKTGEHREILQAMRRQLEHRRCTTASMKLWGCTLGAGSFRSRSTSPNASKHFSAR